MATEDPDGGATDDPDDRGSSGPDDGAAEDPGDGAAEDPGGGPATSNPDPSGSAGTDATDPGSAGRSEGFTVGDIAAGVPLVLGGIAWVADALLEVAEFTVGGATVETGALATGLVAAGFLAHAVDRALVGERAVAGVVAAFAVGLAVAFVGRSSGGLLQVVGTVLMVVGVAAYVYLTYGDGGSGS